MEEIKTILRKYNWPKRTKLIDKEIKLFENKIDFQLPDDYRYFLKHFLGYETFLGNEYVRLLSLEDLIGFNTDYCIFESFTNTLGIGGNGSGEFIAIEHQHSIRIVLSPFISLDKEDHIEIGSSFSNFLFRLDQGKEWFN